ncbi:MULTISPECIES: tyrosine-type recombinase/integrase [Acinetobacter]|uniref:tyrosine-type recombinase/integrase n=1 Tax=Acinetobacter TaxID=469 RepID=UPI0021CD8653|nr:MULTISPECIES: site-specific integrase [Acinetobacter]MCU4377608.1 site-specific integrase [Acinetobacter haemolyticus]MDH1859179.1 site-specific integrase [Acinetobacter junii]
MAKLTDLRIRKIKPTDKNTKYSDGGGLYLMVTPKGSFYWRYKYRFDKKEFVLAIGVYPNVSLSDARIRHLEAKKLLHSGVNPSADKQSKKFKEKQEQPFSKIVEIYIKNEAIKHKGYRWEMIRLNKILRDFPELSKKAINQIDQSDMINFRNKRSLHIQGTSVKREMQLLGSVFRYAIRELRLIDHSPLANVTKPRENPHREMRISNDDIDILLKAFQYANDIPLILKKHQAAWAFLFALETSMRLSEITNMRWEHIADDYVLLPNTKNGSSRKVPLSRNALALLDRVKGLDSEVVITISANSLSTTFRKYRDTTPLTHINFHDTRHEACTKFAQIMPIQDLAKVTGHKDLAMLMRYYNPTASELAHRINEKLN